MAADQGRPSVSSEALPPIKRVTTAADVPALELTPAFANKANVTMNALTTRLAFGEFAVGDQNKDVNYHTVIVMPTADAVAIAQLIIAAYQQSPPAQDITAAIKRIGEAAAAQAVART